MSEAHQTAEQAHWEFFEALCPKEWRDGCELIFTLDDMRMFHRSVWNHALEYGHSGESLRHIVSQIQTIEQRLENGL
jgi:hypothetical protein